MKIRNLETKIRDYINSPRLQSNLLKDKTSWNKLCSSLDVLGDTELAIDEYLIKKEPTGIGEKYLFLYGILQILFVQQDATRNLAEALSIKYDSDTLLDEIREIRNNSVGHPTKRGRGKGDSFNFIVRMSISSKGFTLMTTYPKKKKDISKHVNVVDLINTQRIKIKEILTQVITILEENEMIHRKKHRVNKLFDCFPPTLSYYFEKISESLHGNMPSEFGLIHIKLISESIDKFKNELSNRGTQDSYDWLNYHLDLIDYPINMVTNYFSKDSKSRLNEKDVNIFVFFIEKQINEIMNMAEEIDIEYSSDL